MSTLESVANTLQAVFPGAEVLALAGQDWDSDTIRSVRCDLNQDTLEVTPQGDGALLATWHSNEKLTNKRHAANVRVAKDRQIIETDADIIGWAGYTRAKLTRQHLTALLQALRPNEFLPSRCCAPGSEAIKAVLFFMVGCKLSPVQVAKSFWDLTQKEGWALDWRPTKGGKFGLGVLHPGPPMTTSRGARVAGAVAVGSKEPGHYAIRAKVEVGRPNPLFGEGTKPFDFDLRAQAVLPNEPVENARARGEMLLYRGGIGALWEMAKTYRQITLNIASR
jgi:hypothetical protein